MKNILFIILFVPFFCIGQNSDIGNFKALRLGGAGITESGRFQINGTIIYNTSLNKFRAYQNGIWVDAIGGVIGGSNTQVLYNNAGAIDGITTQTYSNANNTTTFTATVNDPAINIAPTATPVNLVNGNIWHDNSSTLPFLAFRSNGTTNQLLHTMPSGATNIGWSTNATAGYSLTAVGSLANISISLVPKGASNTAFLGTGNINLGNASIAGARSITALSSTANANLNIVLNGPTARLISNGSIQTNANYFMNSSGSLISVGSITITPAINNNINLGTTGTGLITFGGNNIGTATLVSGTVTINNANISATTVVLTSITTPSGTVGTHYCSARVAGTSFTITSTSGTDNSSISYALIN